jgi:protein JSN1
MYWSSPIGSSNPSPSKTPTEPTIPEGTLNVSLLMTDIPSTESSPGVRRARAGTVPSRFTDDFAALNLQPKHASSSIDLASHANKVSTPPTVTPLRHPSYLPPTQSQSAAAARLRSGSLTLPRAIYSNSATPFGPSIFSSSYVSRIGISPASPAQSAFSRDDEQTPVKTLDYLGLADTPTPPRGLRGMPQPPSVLEHEAESNGLPPPRQEGEPLPGYLSATSRLRDASRIRSYSVADKDKYDEEHAEYDEDEDPQVLVHSTYLQEVQTTPKSHYSNLYVDSHSPRPRASTTGVINSPPSLTTDMFGGSLHPHLDRKQSRGHQSQYQNELQNTNISRPISREDQQYYPSYGGSDDISSQPSRALWLATIPQGVSQQHLESIFGQFGGIESSRVLTHKNCGFVNFIAVEDAVAARAALGGRELFPGNGGIKIGFAKVPSGIVLSPSPEPLMMGENMQHLSAQRLDGSRSRSPALPPLRQVQGELIQILAEYGANDDEIRESTESLARAGSFNAFQFEVPPIPEASTQRMYDAPKLRDIRKRIDNGACGAEEIEHIAVDMLPEVAELSSDYLGNTVVQKLFENCSEEVKTQMLVEIAPYLASIGVHKNGTWAAQKIIDMTRTAEQVFPWG